MSQPTITITTGVLTGNLFGDHTEGIDVEASADRYAALLRDAIEAAYPTADVTVRSSNASGSAGFGDRTHASVVDDHGDQDTAREEEIVAAVDAIGDALWSTHDWYVDVAPAIVGGAG